MTQLSPDAQRLLARSKQLDDPSHAERERMRARLEASWQQGAPPAPNTNGMSARWRAKIVVGGVASLAAFFAAGAWQRMHTAPLSAASVAARPQLAAGLDDPSAFADSRSASGQVHEASLREPAARVARRESGAAVVRARNSNLVADASAQPSASEGKHARLITTQRALPLPATVQPASVNSAPASIDQTRRERRTSYAASNEPAADQPANTRTPAPTPEAIDDEVLLLGAAQDALQSGHPSRALQLVQQHGFRFPTGALQQERLTVHVLALCALQRTNAARQIYAQLQRQAGQSPVLARVRADCGF